MTIHAAIVASEKNSKGVVIHRIKVTDERGQEWYVHKRFSDFVELDGGIATSCKLPSHHRLPSAFMGFASSQRRVIDLNQYLSDLVQHVQMLSQDPLVAAFLKAGSSSSDGVGSASSPCSRANTEELSKFRYEQRSSIPDGLVQGPFEDIDISGDVYSTAYLIARNATPGMYSIWPWLNKEVRIVWAYLFFIIFSQLFVVVAITVWYPAVVGTESVHVNCDNQTAVTEIHARGFLSSNSTDECREKGQFAFEADVRGETMALHTVERRILFHHSILMGGDRVVFMIRLICCVWVFSQAYLQHFESVRRLLHYRDFTLWFLPVKGEIVRNSWTICIPLMQYGVLLVVTTVSVVIISAQDEPFDIVVNSLAFTFIFEVGSYFNDPLARRMSETKISGIDPSYGEICYLYPEYKESNAINADGSYTDSGWYILEDEKKAGLLSDYRLRHNPCIYPHASERLISILEKLLLFVPVVVVLCCAVSCGSHTKWLAVMRGSEL